MSDSDDAETDGGGSCIKMPVHWASELGLADGAANDVMVMRIPMAKAAEDINVGMSAVEASFVEGMFEGKGVPEPINIHGANLMLSLAID